MSTVESVATDDRRRSLALWHRVATPWRSLRGRAALSLAATVLVLSVIAAVAVWISVSQYLLLQRERSTLAQVMANADQVQRLARPGGLSRPQALAELSREIGSTSLLVDEGQWWTTSLEVGREDLPRALREAAIDGQPSRQRIRVGDKTMLAVGVPLPRVGQAYFEVFPLTELNSTFRVLGVVLGGAVVTVPLMALLLGWWVTAPALRPVVEIALAAKGFAAGDLETRMDSRGHPELVPIAALFNQAAGALEKRVQADARFAGDVSHELRNPLTTMMGSIAVLEQHRDRFPADAGEAVDLLASEVHRFAQLVEDLLELSRMEDGAGELDDHGSVRLAELVRWSVPQHLRHCIRIEENAREVSIYGDRRRLERAVANLVQNAERHGNGLEALTVSGGSDCVRVTVDDAGPGVPEADRERIFERFARGQGSSRASADGTGLGLALVARHVRLLGGEVSVERSPQDGARFAITLPVDHQEHGELR